MSINAHHIPALKIVLMASQLVKMESANIAIIPSDNFFIIMVIEC